MAEQSARAQPASTRTAAVGLGGGAEASSQSLKVLVAEEDVEPPDPAEDAPLAITRGCSKASLRSSAGGAEEGVDILCLRCDA